MIIKIMMSKGNEGEEYINAFPKLKKWINDTDENFDKVEFDDGYLRVRNYLVPNIKFVMKGDKR